MTDSRRGSGERPGHPARRGSGERPGHPARPATETSVAAALVVASGNLLNELRDGLPETSGQWAMLLVSSLILGGFGFFLLPLIAMVPGYCRSVWRWSRRRARWPVFAVAAAVVALAVTGGILGPPATEYLQRRLHGCPRPTELRVLTATEDLEPTKELAAAYEKAAAAGAGGCRAVSLFVYAAPGHLARTALAAKWSQEFLIDVGPRPDVWLPTSTMEVEAVQAEAVRTGDSSPIAGPSQPIGYSPIVLAVDRSAPASLTGPTARSWGDLLDQLTELGWGLARTDPQSSVISELATDALYRVGDTGVPVPADRARAIERAIDRGLDDGGFPIDDFAGLVCRYRALAAASTADRGGPAAPRIGLVMSEQTLVRYNLGKPLGGNCVDASPPGGSSLVAAYPTNTLSLNHPFVRFSWPGPDGQQPAAAAAFERWLRGSGGREEVLAAGLRPAGDQPPHDPLSSANGVTAGAAFDRHVPGTTWREEVRERYTAARRSGRVLVAVDASGSMGTQVGERTRFEIATQGVIEALDLMGPRDEFGLWVFPAAGGAAGATALIPLGAAQTSADAVRRRQATQSALSSVGPTGGTPLYSTVIEAVGAAGGAGGEPAASSAAAVVVLTDGEDTAGRITPDEMIAKVRGTRVRVFVIAVGEASCGSAALSGVTVATGGSCREAGFDTVDDALRAALGTLWKGALDAG